MLLITPGRASPKTFRRREADITRMSTMDAALSIQYFLSDDGPTVNHEKTLCAEGDADSRKKLDWRTYYPETTSAMRLTRGWVEASERRSRSVMRTSCDYCGMRKRKCDGEGKRTCSLCKKKGLTCIYSKKLPNRPHRSSGEQDDKDVGVLPHEGSLKRCRLSASPATGLVGMAENALLSAYFECMGFNPITCQSNVREAMVRIMTSHFATPTLAFAPTRWKASGTGEVIRHGLPSDPCLCSFWFAVAMGGLVQGRPKEAVGAYILRAKAAVDAYSKVPTPDLARAWLQMAMMSAFSGDLEGFRIYVGRALQVVSDLTFQGSLDKMQPGLLEMVEHSKVLLLMIGNRNSQEDLQSFVSHDLGPSPQVGNIVTLEEIARFSMHAFRRQGQAFFADALANRNKGGPEVEDINSLRSHDIEAQIDPCLEQRADLLPDVVITDEFPVRGNTGKLLQELAPIYERLENVAERPSIRSGIGSLVINVPLCITRIARQDTSGAVETASRAVEVLLSYPGLIRSEVGMHICHFLLTVLSTLASTELVEKLRVVYNEHRSHGPMIPPMEEWESEGPYCNNSFCRIKLREFRERILPQIEPDLSNAEEETTVETAFSNVEEQQPSTAGTTSGCRLEKGPDQPTMKSGDPECHYILEVGSTVVCEEQEALDAFALGSSGDELDATTGWTVHLGDLDNQFDEVEKTALCPEDWEIAIDALLEDVTADLAR